MAAGADQPLIPQGLPVSDDTEKYTTVRMAVRDFPRLTYRYDMHVLERAVRSRLAPVAQRPGRVLLLVYDAVKLRTFLTDLDSVVMTLPLPDPAGIGRLRPARDRPLLELAELERQIEEVRPAVTVAAMDVLRRAGLSWKQVAERMGVSDARAAYKAARRKAGPVKDEQEVLEWAEMRLFAIDEHFRQTAEYPGYLHDIRGQLLLDPDGNPEINEDARNKALMGQIKVIEVETKLRGVIAPSRSLVTHDLADWEQRLLSAYSLMEERAQAQARQQLALEAGDIVEGEVLRDEEAEHVRKKPRRKQPRRADADDSSSSERAEQ